MVFNVINVYDDEKPRKAAKLGKWKLMLNKNGLGFRSKIIAKCPSIDLLIEN